MISGGKDTIFLREKKYSGALCCIPKNAIFATSNFEAQKFCIILKTFKLCRKKVINTVPTA